MPIGSRGWRILSLLMLQQCSGALALRVAIERVFRRVARSESPHEGDLACLERAHSGSGQPTSHRR